MSREMVELCVRSTAGFESFPLLNRDYWGQIGVPQNDLQVERHPLVILNSIHSQSGLPHL
jgi:hypothetical protein